MIRHFIVAILLSSAVGAFPAPAEDVALADAAGLRIEIGVVEERQTGEVDPDSPAGEINPLGVRVVFFWDDEHWHSYQEHSDKSHREAEQPVTPEITRRRSWYLAADVSTKAIVAEAKQQLPNSTWHSLQEIVYGQEVLPKAESSAKYAGWIGVRVRPPLAVSTVLKCPMDYRLPSPVPASDEVVPEGVYKAGREAFRPQLDRWQVEDPQAPHMVTEMKSALGSASSFVIEREKVMLYQFAWQPEPVEMPLLDPPLVGEDQVTNEAWPIGGGLVFICGGDFNLDGDWEYLFWIDRYNENGYLLASEKLRRISSSTWHYH